MSPTPPPTNAVIVEAVAEAVLVAVVDPLGDPDDGLGLGVLSLVLQVGTALARLTDHQLLQLVVELPQVAVGWPCAAISEK